MIDCSLENGVGRVTLNRPKVHNSLTRQAMSDIRAVLADWATSDIRVLVLTGTGKSFCSGVSLGEVGDGAWSNKPLTDLCNAIEEFHTPTICALNGGVYGGGVELALSCDFRVGVRGMKMFVPAVEIGVHYDPDGIARYIQKLGAQTARRVFLLAERFDADGLKDIGFLDFLVKKGALSDRVNELVTGLTSTAPLAVQGIKRTILEISRGTLNVAAGDARIAECFASDDHREGMAALSEKRTPKFTGR